MMPLDKDNKPFILRSQRMKKKKTRISKDDYYNIDHSETVFM